MTAPPKMTTRILSEGVVFSIGNFLSRAVFFLMTIALTRFFLPEEYGRYVLVKTAILFGAILDTWLLESVMRFYAEHACTGQTASFRTRVWTLATWHLAATAVVALCIVMLLPGDAELRRLLLTAAVIYALDYLYRLHLQILRAKRDAWGHSLLSLAYAVLRLGFALVLIFGWKLCIQSLLYAWIGADAVLLPILVRRSGRVTAPATREPLQRPAVPMPSRRELFRYGAPFVLLAAGWTGLYIADRFMLQWLQDASQVGLYGLAYSFSELGYIIPYMLIGMPAQAATMEMWAEGREDAVSACLTRLVRCHLLVAIPLIAALATLSGPIIVTIAREAYAPAAHALPLLAPGLLGWGLLAFSNLAFMLKKRTDLLAKLGMAGFAGNVILTLLLIPRFGFLGAAAATSISYVALAAAGWLTAYRHLHLSLRISWRSARNAVLATLILVAATQVTVRTLPTGLLSLAATGCMGVLAYGASLLLLGEWRIQHIFQVARECLMHGKEST